MVHDMDCMMIVAPQKPSTSLRNLPSLKLTLHLKIDLWKRRFLLETHHFQVLFLLVSGRNYLSPTSIPPFQEEKAIWVFPKIMVPQNGWFIMENPIKMDDLGENTPIFGNIHFHSSNSLTKPSLSASKPLYWGADLTNSGLTEPIHNPIAPQFTCFLSKVKNNFNNKKIKNI